MKQKESPFDLKFIDELAKKYPNPEDIFGKTVLIKKCRKNSNYLPVMAKGVYSSQHSRAMTGNEVLRAVSMFTEYLVSCPIP